MNTIGWKMSNVNEFLRYLDLMFPDATCELNYNKDYEFLISVMLSAQTTDKRVNMVTSELFKKYDTLEKLSTASVDDIKSIIKPIGTYNRKAFCVIEIAKELLNKYDGSVPNTHEKLEKLAGVGHKTANAVLGTIYHIPSFAVDTHVSRVSKRLGFATQKDDVNKIEAKLKRVVPKDKWIKTHHQMVLFGRYHCKSQKPECSTCLLNNKCKYFNKKKI